MQYSAPYRGNRVYGELTPMAGMKWTKADKERVRGFIRAVAATVEGGQAGIARELNIEKRATVNHWLRRGRVPVDHVPGLLKLAPPEFVGFDATHLCPEGRALVGSMPAGAP